MSILDRSLARRMAALILIGAGLVLVLVLGFSHFAQRRRLLADAMRHGDTLAQSVAYRIEAQLGPAEAVVRQVALDLGDEEIRRAASADLIRRTLENNPDLLGMAVALSEDAASHSDFQILYGWRQQTNISIQDREHPVLDYQHDWFCLPYHLGRPVWIEPYYDTDAQALMVTYSVPVRRGDQVVAVVTCDLSLQWIRQMLDALPLGEGGLAILLSRRGTFVSHPQRELEMRETIFSLAESQPDPARQEELRQLGQEMLGGKPGHRQYRRPDGRAAFMHYYTVPSTSWTLGLIFPKAQVLAPLVRLNHLSALIGLAGIVLLLVPALGVAWTVARPLRQLAESARRLAGGDFGAPLPRIRSRDEVAQLTEAFGNMRRDLRQYIADLTSTTAARERIAGELSAAREIQLSIVPKLFPPFPNRTDIDLYALLVPAREVGGDLYDFMLLDDDHLYLAIGDVSGKGIPASLLMAVGKTLLKSAVQVVRAPARALAQVNGELAENNESCMFVSMFCGILNLASGDFIYANAGHNPPFLVRRDGAIAPVDGAPGAVLGAFPGSAYCDRSLRLAAGDLLVLYTDGVTEAMDAAGAMFGEDGLVSYLRNEGGQEARPLLEGLVRQVHAHAGDIEQSDDITALAIRYRGRRPAAAGVAAETASARAPAAVLTLPNRIAALPRLTAWVEAQVRTPTMPPALAMAIDLSLEEWVTNVISHAYDDDAEHAIVLRLWRDGNELRFEVEDDGKPFDPTCQAAPDIALPLEHRPIGGLGIHFIRNSMDRFSYRREGGRNLVAMAKSMVGIAAAEANLDYS